MKTKRERDEHAAPTKHRDELAAATKRVHTWDEKHRAAAQSRTAFAAGVPPPPHVKAMMADIIAGRSVYPES
jgi:hypothetical protein